MASRGDDKLARLLSSNDKDTRAKAATCPVCFSKSCEGCVKVHRAKGKGVTRTGKRKKTVHKERKDRARRRGVL